LPGDCMHYTYAHMEVCRLSPPARRGVRSRTSERASGGWSDERASERARAVITFYFKDGRGSFAILCRTSICLIYRNYTYTDPVRFCHNLYPEYRRTRPAVSFCVRVYGVSWRSDLSRSENWELSWRKWRVSWLAVVITKIQNWCLKRTRVLGVSSSAQSFIRSTILDYRWGFYLYTDCERKILVFVTTTMCYFNYDNYCYNVIILINIYISLSQIYNNWQPKVTIVIITIKMITVFKSIIFYMIIPKNYYKLL